MTKPTTPAGQVACVIVNYNAGNLLENCLKSCAVACAGMTVVIVDNASTDVSLDFLSDWNDAASVQVLRNSQNKGFSVAVNQGLGVVTEDRVLVLNPDCLLSGDAVAAMNHILTITPEAGMVGPLLINPDGSEQAGGRRAIPTPWRSLVRASGLSRLSERYPRLFSDFQLHKEPLPNHPIDVEAISGACMLIRREALESVGLLDEGYFMHCEDLDWCMRFRQGGWRILFVPEAKVIHYKGVCSRARPIFVEWHKHQGMMRFYKKFFRHQYPGVLMWLVSLGVWLRFGALFLYFSARHVARAMRLMDD